MSQDIQIQNTLKVLREGGTILYPTDTIWGIGCDATNEIAIAKIYDIKKRLESKNLIVLAANDAMLERYVKGVPDIAWELIDASKAENNIGAKPLTIIYEGARGLAQNIIAQDGSIAIRIVQDDFCQKLIYKFGKPIVSTSANISGTPNPQIFDEITDEIKTSVNYVVDWRQNETGKKQASSIIRVKANSEIEVIRE